MNERAHASIRWRSTHGGFYHYQRRSITKNNIYKTAYQYRRCPKPFRKKPNWISTYVISKMPRIPHHITWEGFCVLAKRQLQRVDLRNCVTGPMSRTFTEKETCRMNEGIQ